MDLWQQSKFSGELKKIRLYNKENRIEILEKKFKIEELFEKRG